MNILLTSPFTPVSSNIHSHRAAQAAIYAEQLSSLGNVHLDRTGNIHQDTVRIDATGNIHSDSSQFDRVYVYHGNDWFGSLNPVSYTHLTLPTKRIV